MTVQTTTSRADYTGNGVTTAFTVPFYFLDNTHITVLRTQISTGVITTLTLTTDYIVSGAGVSGGGTVTCTTAPTTDQKLSILRSVPLTQLVHYVPNDPFPAATHEQALDQLTMEVQQVNEVAGRALQLPANTPFGSVSSSLPTPSANKVIAWNSTGTGLQNVDAASLATAVTTGTAKADLFSGDGSTRSFVLSSNPGAQPNLDVSISGVSQRPGIDYTWTSGTTLTFTSAPPSGTNNILVRYWLGLPLGTSDSASALFIQSGVGAVTRVAQDKLREVVSVKDFGAAGDGTTNDTAAIAAAIAAAPTNGSVYFPPGTYRANIFVYKSNISLIGAGSAATTIKLPNSCPSVTVPWEGGGNVTGLPNVIEVGECALGNSANTYSSVAVKGMTLDGNYTNNIAPTMDLFGHGLIATKTSKLVIDDVVSQNCYLTGIDCVINSNYARINARVDTCGNATISGGHYPNFDINSSKYGVFNVISSGGYYGGRMLDNCYGNQLNITIYNPSITGLVYNNQTVNSSYSNTINVTVVDGCNSGQGVSIGANVYDSIINATVRNVVGVGFYVSGGSSSYAPRGNKFNVNTFYCGAASVYDAGYFNQYNIASRLDGKTGAAGSVFAVDINGSYNQFTISIEDASTPQVRGVAIRSGAQYNNILDYKRNTTVQDFFLQDTSNTNVWAFQYADGVSLKWQTPSLNAGWNNTYGSPYPAVQYIKDTNGFVRVKGTVNGGSGTIFTLPAGFRPVDTMIFPTWANSAIGRLTVDSSGNVSLPTGTATSVDLSPIVFATY